MGKLRRNYNRFVTRNRNKGIPNLMLWICAANAVVFLLNRFTNGTLASALYFNAAAIMQGEVWRLVTYIFTFACGSSFLFSALLGAVITIMFYYWVGKVLETTWGTLRFNIFYFSGVLITDLAGLLLYWCFGIPVSLSAHFLNLSMFLAMATLAPETRVYLYGLIPVKMKWMAWLDLGLTVYQIISSLVYYWAYLPYFPTAVSVGYVLYAFFPLVALLNYFLFFGRGIKALLPNRMQRSGGFRQQQRRAEFRRKSEPQPNPDWAKNYRSESGARPYRHKCTVCGRTDTDCPDLEFRYCSKCKGYFCYCIDHINNHTHIQ